MDVKKLMLLGFYLISLSTYSQEYTFISHGVESGLAQSQVFALEQDNHGYIWAGTLGGLSRFDGIGFRNFSVSDGLLSNHITTIKRLKNNDLVFGHPGGITFYDGLTFDSFSMNEKLGVSRVTCVIETSSNLFFGTDNEGLFQLKNGVLETISQKGFENLNIRQISAYKNGLLLATQTGIVSYINETFEWWNTETLKGKSCSGVVIDSITNIVWISTYGDGVFKVEADSISNLTSETGLISSNVRGIYRSSQGKIWLFTKVGVTCIDEEGSIINLNRKNGLKYDNIFTILEDRERNIWFGSDGGGIFKYTGPNFLKYTTNNGLSSNLVMSILQDDDEALWFSTYGEGITRLKGKKLDYFNLENGLGNNTIWSSIKTSDDKLWFCSSDGIYIYHNNNFEKLEKSDGLISSRITAIFEDSKHRIWLGAREGLSLIEDNEITNFSASDGQIGAFVRTFSETKTGEIIIGTSNGIYDYNNKTLQALPLEGAWCDKVVLEIKISANGWWIGSANGLQFYNGQEVTCVRLNDNFSSNYINFIEVINSEVWVGTNNGLFYIDENQFLKTGNANALRYAKHEGFSSTETNLHASFSDIDGNLWFGTADGVFKLDRNNKQKTLASAPYVHINNVQLFLQTPNWEKRKVNIDPTSGLPLDLKVTHRENYFTFLYTGLYFTNPTEVSYQFMLEGFDEFWLPPTKANFATYSNLPHGEYTFKVKAINKFGAESTTESFTFKITPPFWLTWWFYTFVFITISWFIYVIYNWQKVIANRKKQNQLLIDQSKMLGLEHQTLNASMNRHFIFNSLNSIQYYINRQDKLSANKYLTRFAKLIRKNLDSSETPSCLLSDELERLELYLSLELMRFAGKFEYQITIDEHIDPDNIYVPSMLLQPFVENSIWHGILPSGKMGLIQIKMLPEGTDRIKFVIEDNGIGIDKSLASKNEINNPHNSKGMKITQDRILLLKKMTGMDLFLNGPSEIKQEEKTLGTTVEMVLPKENAELYY